MGIKHFFYWFRYNHSDCLQKVAVDKPLSTQHVEMDVLAIDLNGMFHNATQKVFAYGNGNNKNVSLIRRVMKPKTEKELRLQTFKEVCYMIDRLVDYVAPKKQLLLCVDGVAGVSKCQQQRQRRFKSAKERSGVFDSCSITPGTQFMHYLTQYIEWYITHRINNGDWTFEVVFSNEKVVGEGEHKCKTLFKKYCDPQDRMMIYGLDADLIMLCLSTGLSNIFVLRDNLNNINERYIVNINAFSNKLKEKMQTDSAVIDFVLLCFMVGNDFLPTLPGLEIASNGIDYMIDAYNRCCRPIGLVDPITLEIHIDQIVVLFKALSEYELQTIQLKYKNRHKYFEDPLLNTYFGDLNSFTLYREKYYATKCNNVNVHEMCAEYVKGLQWVIKYYGDEIPSWDWCYPYHYAPFLHDLGNQTYSIHVFTKNEPLEPYEQLLAVLPPQSKNLLPQILHPIMEQDPLKPMYPSEFKIDIDGKHSEWEGIALLPLMNIPLLRSLYQKYCDKTPSEFNCREQTVTLQRRKQTHAYHSIYGNIAKCKVFKSALLLS